MVTYPAHGTFRPVQSYFAFEREKDEDQGGGELWVFLTIANKLGKRGGSCQPSTRLELSWAPINRKQWSRERVVVSDLERMSTEGWLWRWEVRHIDPISQTEERLCGAITMIWLDTSRVTGHIVTQHRDAFSFTKRVAWTDDPWGDTACVEYVIKFAASELGMGKVRGVRILALDEPF